MGMSSYEKQEWRKKEVVLLADPWKLVEYVIEMIAGRGAGYWALSEVQGEVSRRAARGQLSMRHLYRCKCQCEFKRRTRAYGYSKPTLSEFHTTGRRYVGLLQNGKADFVKIRIPAFFTVKLEQINAEREERDRGEARERLAALRKVEDIRKRIYMTRIFPPALRTAIHERDSWRCKMCKKSLSELKTQGLKLVVHHIVHWEQGGLTSYDNGQTLCNKCHGIKHKRREHPLEQATYQTPEGKVSVKVLTAKAERLVTARAAEPDNTRRDPFARLTRVERQSQAKTRMGASDQQ